MEPHVHFAADPCAFDSARDRPVDDMSVLRCLERRGLSFLAIAEG